MTSLAFGTTILVLVWFSQRHYGLGTDDGSSIILFGWRFTPTLLAVIYTQMTVILFEDVKRTEPFARLAKAPSDGASASGTVLYQSMSVFFDVTFKRKSVGKTSWCLIFAAFVNTLAMLAISPLSSALLTSEEVIIPRTIEFSRIVPRDGVQLPLVANRETYFRTIGALMRNVSTSAWITDSSLTLPFWPSSEEMQLSPNLVSTAGSWETETTRLHTSLSCQNMTLESAEMTSKPFSGAYDITGKGPYNGTQPMVSFVLSSHDGCRYELSLHPNADIAYNGGSTWSNASTFYPVWGSSLYVGRIPFAANISSTSPYARLKTSDQCRDREIIFSNTPWTKSIQLSMGHGPALPLNQTYERSPSFRMKAMLCESRYTMEKLSVIASMSSTKATTINTTSVSSNVSEVVPRTLVDLPKFQELALQDNWKNYFNRVGMSYDADNAMDKNLQADAAYNYQAAVPSFSGIGPLLAALYSFNISAMLDDPHLVEQAARVKGRFFTESLRDALTNNEVVQSKLINGESTVIEERVMVLREIGITLAALFFLSSLLLLLTFWFSRLSHRPLDLQTDPSSAVGLSMLLDPQLARTSAFKKMHQKGSKQFYSTLRTATFCTSDGTLQTGNNVDQSVNRTISTEEEKPRRKWRPLVIRVRALSALVSFFVLIAVAVLILSLFSSQSRLSQVAFVYKTDVSRLGLSFPSFAPISIAPTVVSIVIGLWWGQLDMMFRVLQPFISMSREPTPITKGAGLSYRSNTWVGAAIKAARNRHFVLLMVATGSVLCQVLTVSMSALFERQAANITQKTGLNRTLSLRRDPVITKIRTEPAYEFGYMDNIRAYAVLDELYLDPPKNWLAGAAIQLSLNSSQLPWTSDGWSFVPLDLSELPDYVSVQKTADSDVKGLPDHPTNVTLQTTGIRARLECDPIQEISNVSSWIAPIKEGDGVPDTFNTTGVEDYYWLNSTMFDNTPSNTSAFANTNRIQCCTNNTHGTTHEAAIGYWSPTDAQEVPHASKTWPIPFVTKWIVGKPIKIPLGSDSEVAPALNLLLFKEVPLLQAARCIPIIEMADTIVTVDKVTASVFSYELSEHPRPADSAWSDVFGIHDLSNTDKHYNQKYTGPLNITTSFGVLFMDAMFRASDPDDVNTGLATYWQPVEDNAFVMHDQEHGLNMDFMTYSMYAAAAKDAKALLDYTTLVRHADRTFQTFFQHFVANGMSLKEGGLAYQGINDRSLEDLGRLVDINGTALPARQYPTSDTNSTAEAWVSNRVQVLHMNPIATYLTIAILIWLIGTTAVVMCLQRRYMSCMVRDVQLIADILVLVAGSDNLLKLVHERGISLKRDEIIKTKLGWFKDQDGEIRWGVEVVGGTNAVEWVDTPKEIA
ncbi:hypothetical protein P153DRAFT_390003 [Dothidotthia symphoricarpi CBS 119687]|uniref:Uncharacterized protein n=1 Tax=Dothidotthia symphoricarpi CBS 119687 TaxID=1392245 RepID=A0A6A6A1T2_9PLEO|nr:uncharacterized protein P153DRAFT_390003 [Dothidotthia symphoricarpi CBS 119687]KAF2125155.1 hypothetical protein P153DRAFT_390003 [Dothidotthia symphoricarpi CBS 119687]